MTGEGWHDETAFGAAGEATEATEAAGGPQPASSSAGGAPGDDGEATAADGGTAPAQPGAAGPRVPHGGASPPAALPLAGPGSAAAPPAVGVAAAAARRVTEHLRSGVPLPPSEPPLVAGRARLIARVANYGDGKTHALRTIWHLAAERNFVVSSVALTREIPFDRLDHVYPQVIADTYLPGAGQPGIERLVQRLTPGGEEARRVLRFAEDNLHPKLHAVLQNLIEGSSTEAVEPLLRDLAQIDMGIAEVKRIHRTNFGRPLKLDRFSAPRDVRDYFRLVDFLVAAAGYAGWVILFDEAELISRLGRGGRAKAYANIGRLTTDGLGCAHLASVFAVASNFYDSVLERRHDAASAAEWLQARGDAEGAEFCRLGIAALQEAALLEPLTPANWLQVMQALLDAHEAAYGWRSGLTPAAFWQEVQRLAPETDTKLRTRLRVAIQWLDLVQQHGRPPQVRLSSLGEVPLDQGAWGDGGEAGPGGPAEAGGAGAEEEAAAARDPQGAKG